MELVAAWKGCAAAVLLGIATTEGHAAVVGVPAPVREVTVYADRAEIVREAHVRLPQGASSLEIAGIPFGVEPDSVRAAARGVPATLGAVELVDRASRPEESPEWIEARTEVERLEGELAALGEQAAVDDALRAFLTSLQAATAHSASRDLGEARADPASIEAVYRMLAQRFEELAARKLERAERKRKLDEELRLARAHLATLGKERDVRSRVAIVEVETEAAGELTLKLTYVTPGAFWRPSYRVALDAESGEVEISTEGVVRQDTREDWNDVALSLSSVAPARGLTPPLLDTVVLQPGIEGSVRHQAKGERMDVSLSQGGVAAAPPPPLAEPRAREADIAQAAIERSAYSVTYRVPGRSTVPADGRDHRVALRRDTLQGELIHRVVPGLEPRAYLTARVQLSSEHPLLAGTARVYSGGSYLGTFRVEEKGPGAELNVPAGVDNRLEVTRVRQPPSSGNKGIGGNKVVVEYVYRTELHNLHDRTLEVVLEDRVPVSQHEQVVVEIDERRTTDGYEDSPHRPGVKLWSFELGAGEKRTIDFAYTVTHPREITVFGLD